MTNDPYGRVLMIAGNWAAILTAIVAVVAYGRYLWDRGAKRRRLETHLKEEKETQNDDQGQRSVLHLMRHLRMTESDVIDAAFRSKVVRGVTGHDEQGYANRLMFEYDDGNVKPGRPGKARF